MKLIEKILLSIIFYPTFLILGALFGIILVPVDMLDSVIWHNKGD